MKIPFLKIVSCKCRYRSLLAFGSKLKIFSLSHSLKIVNCKLRIVALFLFFGLLFLISPMPSVRAQSNGAISPTISISPAIITETLAPGKAKDMQIEITNYGKDPIPLSASIVNIASVSDDGSPAFTQNPTPRSAYSWITIANPDVIVGTGEHKKVNITIKPPDDAVPGGYNAALIFQARLPSYYFDLDTNARILPAVSTSMLLSIATDNPPTIQDLQINKIAVPKLVVSVPIPLVSEITNPTQFYIYSDTSVQISSIFGSKKNVEEFNNTIIFPDSSRKYIATYNSSLWPGIYTANVQLKQGDKVIVASAKFVAIPWQFIILIIVIALIASYLSLRRRFRRAWRVFMGKEKIRPIIR